MQVQLFYRFALLSLVLLYALFVVGASVRASGAGMGCPDWPKCFNQWIPPTAVTQLPADYQTQYADRGYKNTTFNPVKTWTEYGNRLTSTVLGAAVFVMFVFAVLARKQIPTSALLGASGALLGVLINAWLGSVVVASNLHPAVITSHLFFSLITLGCLLLAVIATRKEVWLLPKHNAKTLLFITAPILAALIVQIGLGTHIRELIENHMLNNNIVSLLVNQTTNTSLLFHASLGVGLFVASMALCLLLTSRSVFYTNREKHQVLALVAMISVSCNLILGMALAMRGMAWMQPLHLFFATVALGCILSLCITSLLGIAQRAHKI